jgi:DAACS family dicarboxylate/amino acid:cation (Na+ or H+) symporter
MAAAHAVSHTRILLGLVLGAAIGCFLNALIDADVIPKPPVEWVVANVTRPVGAIFLNLIFLAIIPLVFASLAVGVTRLGGTENIGRVGVRMLGYVLITTGCAAAIGLTLVNTVRPGHLVPEAQRDRLLAEYEKEASERIAASKKKDFGVSTFVNMVPANPFQAIVEKDMLAIIFTALLVGVALTRIEPAKARLIIDFLEGVNQVTDFIIRLAMQLAPLGVFALIFSTTALFGYKLLIALAAFVLTVLAGLAIHLCVVLPLLVKFLGGMSPLEFFRKSWVTMVTAFGTSSSSATLPTAMKCAEEELGVPERLSRFVLPLSASTNHNGTALFESITVLFLAQLFGFDLSLGQQVMVLFLCILTATGVAGVPGGSLPLIGLILVQVNVPAGAIAIVFGVDRILDMSRTMVNVTADLTTAVYVAKAEEGKAPPEPSRTDGAKSSEKERLQEKVKQA